MFVSVVVSIVNSDGIVSTYLSHRLSLNKANVKNIDCDYCTNHGTWHRKHNKYLLKIDEIKKKNTIVVDNLVKTPPLALSLCDFLFICLPHRCQYCTRQITIIPRSVKLSTNNASARAND